MSVPLRFDSRLLEPPTPALPPTRYVRAASSSEVSSLGDLHDDSVSIMPDTPQQRYQHNQYSICQHGQEQQQQYYQQQTQTHRRSTLNSLRFDSTPMGHDNDDDDGFDYENEHVVVRGAIPNSDLRNVSALSISIGAAVGMLLAIVLAQVDGARDAALVKYVLLLPGELYGNGMLCAVLPTVFLNAVLGSMHFSTLNKTKALGSKMLVYFAATTLWASLLGALLALCFVPTFTENNALHLAATVSSNSNTTSPLLAFRCPAGSSNQSLVLQSDGVMRCAPSLERVNSTLFRVEDLAHSFRIPSGDAALRTSGSARAIAMAAAIPTVSDQAMQLLESCFPLNVLDAFARSDVLSVVLAGGALGMALLHFASLSSVAGTSDSSLLLLLVTQSEVILSVLLRALLQALPFAMASLVCGALLRSPRESDVQPLAPSMQDLASLTGVLLFALVLDLATVLGLASVVTKSNPLPFVRQLIPAQLVALGTSSSLLALPTTVRSIAATKQVSMPLAHVVCATGAALNKNGTAVYLSVASVYIVTAAGLQGDALTASHILALVFASVLGACVLPPLPRGSAIVAGAILTSVFDISAGEPGVRVLLAFLLAMDWLCDPLVTALNVTHNAVVALVLAHAMDERFRDPSFASTQEADEIVSDRSGQAPLSSHQHQHQPLQHQVSSISSNGEVFI